MDLKIHLYQLPSWPTHSARKHLSQGALIALRGEDQTWGYADLHPWPTLGDLPLQEQLTLLRQSRPTLQTQLSLVAAQRDLKARQMHIPGVQFLNTISNHHLILESITHRTFLYEKIKQIYKNSRSEVICKWKINPEFLSETRDFLHQTTENFPLLRWRLDMNSLCTISQIKKWWQSLSLATQKQIEYLEDPCPYDPHTWNELETLGIPLAIDLEISRWKNQCSGSVPSSSPTVSHQTTFVFKPAIQHMSFWQQWLQEHPHPFVISSYLDHPVGLLHALWAAETLSQEFPSLLKACGLNLSLSPQQLFEFWPMNITQNVQQGNYWQGVVSVGIGAPSLLEGLAWQTLTSL